MRFRCTWNYAKKTKRIILLHNLLITSKLSLLPYFFWVNPFSSFILSKNRGKTNSTTVFSSFRFSRGIDWSSSSALLLAALISSIFCQWITSQLPHSCALSVLAVSKIRGIKIYKRAKNKNLERMIHKVARRGLHFAGRSSSVVGQQKVRVHSSPFPP